MERLAVSVEEAGRLVGLSKFTIRAYIRKGKIRAVRVGRRLIVPMDSLRELCEQGLPTQPQSKPTVQEEALE